MSEIINLSDGLRIRRLDRMSVTVERFIVGKDGKERWEQASGQGRGPYLTDEATACRWVLDHGLMDGGGESDLKGALDGYRKVATKLERAVKAAVADA